MLGEGMGSTKGAVSVEHKHGVYMYVLLWSKGSARMWCHWQRPKRDVRAGDISRSSWGGCGRHPPLAQALGTTNDQQRRW